METNLEKAKRLLQAHANITGIELPENGYIFKMLKLAAIPDGINNLSLGSVMPSIREYSPEFDEVECHCYELEQGEDNTETCHLGLEIECCNHCYMNKSLYGA